VIELTIYLHIEDQGRWGIMAINRAGALNVKRPQIYPSIENMVLDPFNPRLPEGFTPKTDTETLICLYKNFDLDELADSISSNGFFDEEPIVVVPVILPDEFRDISSAPGKNNAFLKYLQLPDTQYYVIEGNRRVSTIKLLLSEDLRARLGVRNWPQLTPAVIEDISKIPAIVYPTRNDVLPYLGIRHITGIKKWDSFAKARYIMHLLDEGNTIENIERDIGDKQQSIRKNAIAYNLLMQARDIADYDISRATESFSFLILAIGQKNIKDYLGIPPRSSVIDVKNPIGEERTPQLINLLTWIYGDKKKAAAIRESRDITNHLAAVLGSAGATKALLETNNLIEAYELTDGEELQVKNLIVEARVKIEKALGKANRNKTAEVKIEADKCFETMKTLVEILNKG